MGRRMADNIIKAGANRFDLTVYDTVPEANAYFKDKAKVAAKWSDFSSAQAIFMMLPNADSVAQVLFHKYNLVDLLKKDCIIVNSGTIGVDASKQIDSLLKEKGLRFVDAPVSGGVMGAENASLTFMTGGCSNTIKSIEPVLQCMSKKIVYCGEVGKGQAAKICNNMLLAITMQGVCETFSLAKKMNLDLRLLSDIVNTSSGRCWVTEVNNPVPEIVPSSPASRDYKNGFSAQLLLKDIRLAQKEAELSNLNLDGLASVEKSYAEMIGKVPESAIKDMSVLFQHILQSVK